MKLRVENVTMNFSGVIAIKNVNLAIEEGEIHSVIGPNGAGKTTLFDIISGVIKPTSGKIYLNSDNITGLAPHKICQKGISRTFQNIRLFKKMTVLENVLVAYEKRTERGILSKLLKGLSQDRKKTDNKNNNEGVLEILKFMGLEVEINKLGNSLSYGKQRMLEIARAVASNPQIILLDEPTAGMNGSEINKVCESIYKLNNFGLTIICVEHNMNVVMDISDKIFVLNFGEKIAEGKPEEIKNNEKVIEAYLGGEVVNA